MPSCLNSVSDSLKDVNLFCSCEDQSLHSLEVQSHTCLNLRNVGIQTQISNEYAEVADKADNE